MPGKTRKPSFKPYSGAAGGWGSAKSVNRILRHERVYIEGVKTLIEQNRPKGFACVSCAWAKPAKPHALEFCENGAKATAWEITPKRVGADFFARHRLSELEQWSDYELEAQGRLTEPLRWDASSDRYLPVSWEQAFAEIGAELRALDPQSAVFYASGRASLETAYMWALMARLYGNNNLPDSSNMCHESTSLGLPQSIGVPVGTCTLEDFNQTDCILFFGQNVGSNSPRLLHDLQQASQRGVPIITFNPLKERGLERFRNPQSPLQMLGAPATRISSQYHAVKAGGDTAATDYFRRTTQTQLTQRFLPIVKKATDRVGLAKQYNGLASQGASLGLVKAEDASIESYVTRKALDGLYLMIAEQEKNFRQNPVGATSDIVKKVFGALR